MVRADHAPTTAFATEAYTLSPGPPISATVPKQLGSASGQGLETPPTVSDQFVSCLHHLFSAFVDDPQTQDSGSGIQVFANAQNILITGGTFVSHSPSRNTS
jgi:hypothetical protein